MLLSYFSVIIVIYFSFRIFQLLVMLPTRLLIKRLYRAGTNLLDVNWPGLPVFCPLLNSQPWTQFGRYGVYWWWTKGRGVYIETIVIIRELFCSLLSSGSASPQLWVSALSSSLLTIRGPITLPRKSANSRKTLRTLPSCTDVWLWSLAFLKLGGKLSLGWWLALARSIRRRIWWSLSLTQGSSTPISSNSTRCALPPPRRSYRALFWYSLSRP